MSAPVLLEAVGVEKRYDKFAALAGVDLKVRANTVHSVIGPNGAGKTTLIHVLSGALPFNGGRVVFDGNDLEKRPMHERVTLGLARSYQITNIFTRLTVLDNVAMAVQSRVRDWGTSFSFWKPFSLDSAIIGEAHALLAQVSLTGMATRLGGQLSHGEQRSLEVALALATKPKLLLLDEPMAGMGSEESERMVELIEHLAQRVTILLVEHDMDAVFRLADRISVLVGGTVIASGSPEAIRADAEVRRAYLGDDAT